MYNTIVTLKKGEGRTLKAGGAWVYDNEIVKNLKIYFYCLILLLLILKNFQI